MSPLYVATGANSSFGAANSPDNTFVTAPHYLQASLAVNGQGAKPNFGSRRDDRGFRTYVEHGIGYGARPVRGVVLKRDLARGACCVRYRPQSLTATATICSAATPSAASCLIKISTMWSVRSLNLAPFPDSPAGYASRPPTTASTSRLPRPRPRPLSPSPAGVGEAGFFGGISRTDSQSQHREPLCADRRGGSVAIPLTNDRVAATFTGGDPFTSAQSGINSVVLSFGNNTAGTNSSRGTFINNKIYAALRT